MFAPHLVQTKQCNRLRLPLPPVFGGDGKINCCIDRGSGGTPHNITQGKKDMNMATEYILQIQKDYYKRYEKFRDEILKSQRMTFFNKAELLEKMDQDMQEKIAELKEVDFAC